MSRSPQSPRDLECGGKVRSELASVGRRHRFCVVLGLIRHTSEKRCRRASPSATALQISLATNAQLNA